MLKVHSSGLTSLGPQRLKSILRKDKHSHGDEGKDDMMTFRFRAMDIGFKFKMKALETSDDTANTDESARVKPTSELKLRLRFIIGRDSQAKETDTKLTRGVNRGATTTTGEQRFLTDLLVVSPVNPVVYNRKSYETSYQIPRHLLGQYQLIIHCVRQNPWPKPPDRIGEAVQIRLLDLAQSSRAIEAPVYNNHGRSVLIGTIMFNCLFEEVRDFALRLNSLRLKFLPEAYNTVSQDKLKGFKSSASIGSASKAGGDASVTITARVPGDKGPSMMRMVAGQTTHHTPDFEVQWDQISCTKPENVSLPPKRIYLKRCPMYHLVQKGIVLEVTVPTERILLEAGEKLPKDESTLAYGVVNLAGLLHEDKEPEEKVKVELLADLVSNVDRGQGYLMDLLEPFGYDFSSTVAGQTRRARDNEKLVLELREQVFGRDIEKRGPKSLAESYEGWVARQGLFYQAQFEVVVWVRVQQVKSKKTILKPIGTVKGSCRVINASPYSQYGELQLRNIALTSQDGEDGGQDGIESASRDDGSGDTQKKKAVNLGRKAARRAFRKVWGQENESQFERFHRVMKKQIEMQMHRKRFELAVPQATNERFFPKAYPYMKSTDNAYRVRITMSKVEYVNLRDGPEGSEPDGPFAVTVVWGEHHRRSAAIYPDSYSTLNLVWTFFLHEHDQTLHDFKRRGDLIFHVDSAEITNAGPSSSRGLTQPTVKKYPIDNILSEGLEEIVGDNDQIAVRVYVDNINIDRGSHGTRRLLLIEIAVIPDVTVGDDMLAEDASGTGDITRKRRRDKNKTGRSADLKDWYARKETMWVSSLNRESMMADSLTYYGHTTMNDTRILHRLVTNNVGFSIMGDSCHPCWPTVLSDDPRLKYDPLFSFASVPCLSRTVNTFSWGQTDESYSSPRLWVWQELYEVMKNSANERGGSAVHDHAALLCSLLISSGRQAYLCIGRAAGHAEPAVWILAMLNKTVFIDPAMGGIYLGGAKQHPDSDLDKKKDEDGEGRGRNRRGGVAGDGGIGLAPSHHRKISIGLRTGIARVIATKKIDHTIVEDLYSSSKEELMLQDAVLKDEVHDPDEPQPVTLSLDTFLEGRTEILRSQSSAQDGESKDKSSKRSTAFPWKHISLVFNHESIYANRQGVTDPRRLSLEFENSEMWAKFPALRQNEIEPRNMEHELVARTLERQASAAAKQPQLTTLLSLFHFNPKLISGSDGLDTILQSRYAAILGERMWSVDESSSREEQVQLRSALREYLTIMEMEEMYTVADLENAFDWGSAPRQQFQIRKLAAHAYGHEEAEVVGVVYQTNDMYLSARVKMGVVEDIMSAVDDAMKNVVTTVSGKKKSQFLYEHFNKEEHIQVVASTYVAQYPFRVSRTHVFVGFLGIPLEADELASTFAARNRYRPHIYRRVNKVSKHFEKT